MLRGKCITEDLYQKISQFVFISLISLVILSLVISLRFTWEIRQFDLPRILNDWISTRSIPRLTTEVYNKFWEVFPYYNALLYCNVLKFHSPFGKGRLRFPKNTKKSIKWRGIVKKRL